MITRYLADLVRAGDPYGRLDRWDDDRLLQPYLLDAAARAQNPPDCGVDPAAVERVRTFYQAVAAATERASGALVTVLIDVNSEGFGRAALLAGRLVLLLDPLRDVRRFGFSSLTALSEDGDALTARALAALTEYPEVARADS